LVAGRDDLVDDYLRAVEIELGAFVAQASHLPVLTESAGGTLAQPAYEVDTLYFGGGTPTRLPSAQLRRLAAAVLARHPLAAGYEWTVEANPADVDEALIQTLAELGVTRLSLGAQSFRSEKLQLLERDHRRSDIENAVALARRAGLSVSLDLIFAAPGETLPQWSADLELALDLEPDHLSTYGLTYERGAAFWGRRLRGELCSIDESLERDMYALAIDRLTDARFEHYEVSNFAQPGCRSRHNETYWSGDGYLAYGPGAARYLGGVREMNHRSTTTYLRRVLAGTSPVAEREELSSEARARELLVFGLRRLQGVSRREFGRRTGYEIDTLVAPPLAKFAALGLLNDSGDRIKLTREGLFVSDAIWPEFLSRA
jgi:oxygen-independent coproporphyrinogen-3 oxidase